MSTPSLPKQIKAFLSEGPKLRTEIAVTYSTLHLTQSGSCGDASLFRLRLYYLLKRDSTDLGGEGRALWRWLKKVSKEVSGASRETQNAGS